MKIFSKISGYKTQTFMRNNEKWKILAWHPNKMWQYHQQNPKAAIDAEWTFKCKWPNVLLGKTKKKEQDELTNSCSFEHYDAQSNIT